VLLYPILIPLLIAAMGMTSGLLSGNLTAPDGAQYLRQLIAFGVIYTALSLYMIEFILVV
jgi:ABC-type transport system involved in cytochrome c biogenesis permease component